MKFKVMFNFLLYRGILTEQERTKATPDKTFQTKDSLTNPRIKTSANYKGMMACLPGTCVYSLLSAPVLSHTLSICQSYSHVFLANERQQ